VLSFKVGKQANSTCKLYLQSIRQVPLRARTCVILPQFILRYASSTICFKGRILF
jgi:hypothetical protein